MARTGQTASLGLQGPRARTEQLVAEAKWVKQGSRERQARRVLQAPLDPRVNRAVKAQWARRELRGLPVPRGTRARLLRPARPGTRVRS